MSPSSHQKRKSNQQNVRKNPMKKLLRFQEAEVPVDDEQNDEVSSITSFVQNKHQEELEKLYHEGMINITTKFPYIIVGHKHGVGHIMKELWGADVTKQSDKQQSFQLDQKRNSKCYCNCKFQLLMLVFRHWKEG